MWKQTADTIFLGDQTTQGVYLLRIHVAVPIAVTFGRFQGGRSIPIRPGDYLYIGSALGQRGATSLAGRLLRHATRSARLPPHAMRTPLLAQLQEVGLIDHNREVLPRPKRCFWHIDYLIDQVEAEIVQIIALRTPERLEQPIVRRLTAEPVTTVIAAGLGASDDPHATHLLQVGAAVDWWQRLPQIVSQVAATLPTNNKSEEPDEHPTPHPRQ